MLIAVGSGAVVWVVGRATWASVQTTLRASKLRATVAAKVIVAAKLATESALAIAATAVSGDALAGGNAHAERTHQRDCGRKGNTGDLDPTLREELLGRLRGLAGIVLVGVWILLEDLGGLGVFGGLLGHVGVVLVGD